MQLVKEVAEFMGARVCVLSWFFSFPIPSIYGKFCPVSLTDVQGESKTENRLKIAD